MTLFWASDIVEIKHILLPADEKKFKDIFVVFELMETDLHQVRRPCHVNYIQMCIGSASDRVCATSCNQRCIGDWVVL